MEKDIYKLKLHHHIFVNDGNIIVVRVPGGWIYINGSPVDTTAVFVPMNYEFQETDNK